MVSPPPSIDIREFLEVLSEIFLAIAKVPVKKFLFSKYPAGPFHKTVLDLSTILSILLIVSGPISKIISSFPIDSGFFIDHGAGLVIGETSKVGKNVTIYQQATLGGLTPSLNSDSQRNTKRHPSICDNVIVGSGAQILGPVTIGKNSRIGSNAVVLKDIPENFTYVGIPARKIESKNLTDEFNAYGICEGKIDDPNKKSINALYKEIHTITEKIEELKKIVDVNYKVPNSNIKFRRQKGKQGRGK